VKDSFTPKVATPNTPWNRKPVARHRSGRPSLIKIWRDASLNHPKITPKNFKLLNLFCHQSPLTSHTFVGQADHKDGLFLKDEVLRSSETSVNIYHSTRLKTRKGLTVHTMQRYGGLRTSGSIFFK